METATTKIKVAILGGGIAGLTTAFELTKTQALRDAYEVTIYQMGWRLGGKCATGRDPVNGRIQEHGIHGFSGGYYNALYLMHACYAELPEATRVDDKTSVGVLKSFKDAFKAVDRAILWEVRDQRLFAWPYFIAPNKIDPSNYPEAIKDVAAIINYTRRLVNVQFGSPFIVDGDSRNPSSPAEKPLSLRDFIDFATILYRTGLIKSAFVTIGFWLNISKGIGYFAQQCRRFVLTWNFLHALMTGWKEDKISQNGFDDLDRWDYADWLKKRGANDETLKSAVAYNTIDLAYSYENGDTTIKPTMGAGTYLHWTLRMFLNMGSFIWSFAAGTGETLIAPLFHVLKSRGVKFKFFHKITALRLSDDGASVDSIEFDEQATLKDPGRDYYPLVEHKGLLCWPDRPRYELLNEGEALKNEKGEFVGGPIDLESYWSEWNARPEKRVKTIARGHDRDFDKVVFAISVGAVPHLCKEIMAVDPRWVEMVDAVKTAPTQTMQIWLNTPPGPLLMGDRKQRNQGQSQSILNATFVQPFNGQIDFSELIEYENWPKGGATEPPVSLWYFSGALSDENPTPAFDDHEFPERQRQRVKYQSIQFLQATAGYLWQSPAWEKIASWSPMSLPFETLWSDDPGDKGMTRFEKQYWRANIDPTERYVLVPAGSTRKRLRADGSGRDNLVLAGDWIYNGLNLGSVEGAVMGGMLAADAVQGKEVIGEGVIGYHQTAPVPTP